ncbi:MAG: hemolysin D [Porticoccaceae bacterium]|nr:MAG: hemolysin D [Porticoccaceae bacterium]
MATEPAAGAPPFANGKRRALLIRFAALLLAAALAFALYYAFFVFGFVRTDNAYVGADVVVVTPRIAGAVREVRVSDTDRVARGQVLVVLDDADARAELDAARAQLAAARQRYRQAEAEGKRLAAALAAAAAERQQAEAAVAAAAAEVERARYLYERRRRLAEQGAVAEEELVRARADFAVAEAALEEARRRLAAAGAAREAAAAALAANEVITGVGDVERDPAVRAARARLAAARLALARTVIRAPVAGVVVQRTVQVGQQVAAGAPLMRIAPLHAAWVDANFRETQLARIAPGQRARLISDLYGDEVVYRGRVVGIGGASGAVTALIPPQNATGNWVKVVQRIPVRIALEPKALRAHPLPVGASMWVEVDTRD